ncbi:MAG TPA: hypothetical protein VGO07_01245 [Candidatus Saccharimonadales bacterium]|jgi:hypothetical protein|nr:hypothetical protein [Candidatus Saccharimonadales bacterium]
MQPGTEQPNFTVDDGAPPGTGEAFASLVELIEEKPDATAAFFASVGDTPVEIYLYAKNLESEDESHAAKTARLLSTIFTEEFDQEVELPRADEAVRKAEASGNRDPLKHWRVRRIGYFIGDVASQARTARPQAA